MLTRLLVARRLVAPLRRVALALSLLSLTPFSAGCELIGGDPAPPSPAYFSFGGQVENGASGQVTVLWLANAELSGGDGLALWGDGEASRGSFAIAFDQMPGVNEVYDFAPDYGIDAQLGVGELVLLPEDVVVPQGLLSPEQENALFDQVIGFSARHAVIWRSGTIEDPDGVDDTFLWTSEFAERQLQCGVCVEQPTGFDKYEPVDCSQVVIETDLENIVFCDWQ